MNKEHLNIIIPALPRPTLKEVGANASYITSIKSDTSPIEAVTLELCTVLKEDEEYTNGEEYESRIASLPVLGYQQAAWLVENQDKFPELLALLGKIYIDFPATVVLSSDGNRSIPYLLQGGNRWDLRWLWLWIGNDFDRDGRIAVSSKFSDSRVYDSLESRVLALEEFKEKVEKVIKV